MVESHQNVSSADYNILLKVGRQHTQRTTSESTPGAAILDLLGVRTVLVGKSDQDRFHAKMQIAEGMFLGDRPSALPRAWIVHQVVTVPRFDSRSLQAIERFTRELAFPDNTPRNWREVAVIETDEPLPIVPAGQRTSEEYCEIVEAGPQRVEIKARLASAGLVVLADQLFPGWELEVVTNETVREVPILRTNRVFRGALLGAGEYRLIYRYKPRSFYLGAAITILTTISLFALSVGGVAWHRRNLPLRIISQIRR
jgi:hypothetical protein